MSTVTQAPATLDDLARFDGKAELIGGRIVEFMPSGELPGAVALEITVSLREHARRTGVGAVYGDGVGYAMRPPMPSGRESFSPDASYYTGPRPFNRMSFIDGPPDFAVEVRSENDYGPAAESKMADKRADYFDAGTLAVWDVDPQAELIALYRPADPDQPTVFHRGDIADAEPAVPGWRMSVDAIFV